MKKVYAAETNENGIRIGTEIVNENGAIIECSLCGEPMELGEKAEEGNWWVSCPAYAHEDEHDSYIVEFTDPEGGRVKR